MRKGGRVTPRKVHWHEAAANVRAKECMREDGYEVGSPNFNTTDTLTSEVAYRCWGCVRFLVE